MINVELLDAESDPVETQLEYLNFQIDTAKAEISLIDKITKFDIEQSKDSLMTLHKIVDILQRLESSCGTAADLDRHRHTILLSMFDNDDVERLKDIADFVTAIKHRGGH